MTFYPGTPPTRILSWSQLIRENDPNYTRTSLQPWVYDFSNGRLFIDALPLYGTFPETDDLLLNQTDLPLQLMGGGPLILSG